MVVVQQKKNFFSWAPTYVDQLEPEDFDMFTNLACLTLSCFQANNSDAKKAEFKHMLKLTEVYGLMYCFDVNLPKTKNKLRHKSLAPELDYLRKNRPACATTKRLVREAVSPLINALSHKIDELPGLVNSQASEINQKIDSKLNKLLDLHETDHQSILFKVMNYCKGKNVNIQILGKRDFTSAHTIGNNIFHYNSLTNLTWVTQISNTPPPLTNQVATVKPDKEAKAVTQIDSEPLDLKKSETNLETLTSKPNLTPPPSNDLNSEISEPNLTQIGGPSDPSQIAGPSNAFKIDTDESFCCLCNHRCESDEDMEKHIDGSHNDIFRIKNDQPSAKKPKISHAAP